MLQNKFQIIESFRNLYFQNFHEHIIIDSDCVAHGQHANLNQQIENYMIGQQKYALYVFTRSNRDGEHSVGGMPLKVGIAAPSNTSRFRAYGRNNNLTGHHYQFNMGSSLAKSIRNFPLTHFHIGFPNNFPVENIGEWLANFTDRDSFFVSDVTSVRLRG